MRHNNRHKASKTLDRYDRVYLDIPQCPWLRSMVVEPLKAIIYNTAASPEANVDRLFNGVNGVWELEKFCAINGIAIM